MITLTLIFNLQELSSCWWCSVAVGGKQSGRSKSVCWSTIDGREQSAAVHTTERQNPSSSHVPHTSTL